MAVLKKYPISRYITGVVIVWAFILAAVWYWGSAEHFKTLSIFCGGFFMGLLAMWIAAHLYKI